MVQYHIGGKKEIRKVKKGGKKVTEMLTNGKKMIWREK